MGLDISYYEKVEPVEEGEGLDEDGDIKEGYFQVWANKNFPGREKDLEDKRIYIYEDMNRFRAGSYGGYNQWREQLAELAGYPAVPVDRYGTGDIQHRHDKGAWNAESGPFWELINFSDCDGVIGPVVSKKLAKDFAEYQNKADKHADERFKILYSKWRTAFESASNNGLVDFH